MSITPLPPRLDVACLPTRVRPLDRLSALWGGPRIWIKHDDETGAVLSGNKIRKLQFAVAEAQAQGADVLVTCGGIQSNHCRATAALARRLGMDVVLCLRGTVPLRLSGNLLLDHVLGAEIRWWTPAQYADNEAGMAAVAQQLRAAGRTPYVVAEGCSMAAGVWGYIEAAAEIVDAQREHGVRFDAIVHAIGSAGTSAGLELGVRMHGLSARVRGVCVCDDAAYFRKRIADLCVATIERYGPLTNDAGQPVRVADITEDDIDVIDGYVGAGYAQSQPDELAVLAEVARVEGVVLDPVYSGKAMVGLKAELDGPRFADARDVLFVHTGGIFGLAPHADALSGV